MKTLILTCLMLTAFPVFCEAQQNNAPTPSPSPPVDQQVQVQADAIKQFEESLKPYIEKARKTYPEVKQRFLQGLPRGYHFSITTRIYDEQGRYEQAFVGVKEIKDGVIKGVIESEMNFVTKYKEGDAYSFPEKELIDWTIVRPDRSEEGNVVGKYIDSILKPRN
jgi:hypothetical protein